MSLQWGVVGDKRGDFPGLLHLGGTVTRLNMYPRPILSVLHIPVSWVKSIKGEIILVYSVVLKPKKPQAEMTCRKYLTNTA
jgi:hypothetical protein